MDRIEFIGYTGSGRYTTRMRLAYGDVSASIQGCKFMEKLARVYKTNTQDPNAVTNNVFECLKYID